MQNIWVIALREFRQKITNRGFLISTIATPVILLVVFAFSRGGAPGFGPAQPAQEPDRPAPEMTIGYVDQAGIVAAVPESVPEDSFRPYPDTESARLALTAGEIGAYYVIPADYRQTGNVQRVSPEIPMASPPDTNWMDVILIRNLVPDAGDAEIARLQEPLATGLEVVNITAPEESTGGGSDFLPYLVTVAVIIPLFTSGNYLFQSLSQEKENRIMEILLVSAEPRQLLTGKLIGLAALTLVQYLIWGAIGAIGAVILGAGIGGLLAGVSLTGPELLLVLFYALGGYALYAALMAGVGALTPNTEGGRTWLLLITLPMTVPLYLWMVIVQNPNGIVAQVLSMIPFSAPIAMLMRMTAASVPALQLAVSLGLLVVTVVAMILLMARLFRVSTLLSGEPLSLGRFWRAVTA